MKLSIGFIEADGIYFSRKKNIGSFSITILPL